MWGDLFMSEGFGGGASPRCTRATWTEQSGWKGLPPLHRGVCAAHVLSVSTGETGVAVSSLLSQDSADLLSAFHARVRVCVVDLSSGKEGAQPVERSGPQQRPTVSS